MLGALIGAGINIVAGGIGSAIANRRKRKAEEAYQSAMENEIAGLNADINTNFLDTAEAQNAMRKMTDSNTETLRQLNTEAIRGGATDEAKVAMASKLTRNTASLTGDLAAVGEQRKQALKQQQRGLRMGMAQHKYSQESDTSGIDTILTTVGQAANNIGSAWATRNTTPKADTTSTAGATPTADTAKHQGQVAYGASYRTPVGVSQDTVLDPRNQKGM